MFFACSPLLNISNLWRKYLSLFKRFINKFYSSLVPLSEISIEELVNQKELKKTFDFIKEKPNMPSPLRKNFSHDDLTPLLQIIIATKAKIILELGTGSGNTTANICKNTNAHVYTVNALPEQIAGKITTFILEKKQIGEVYQKMSLDHQVTQIYENTLDMDLSKYLKKDSIDVAIIDACHDIPFVLNDFYKIKPYIKQGGIIFFHDTHPSQQGHLAESYQACLRLRARGYDIKHLTNTWWGIWIKN